MNGIKTMWIAVAAVAAVALVIVGYSWGASRSAGGSVIGGGDYTSGYAAGIAAAKKKLAASGLIPPSPVTVNTVSGTVKSVDTDRFTIAANPVTFNPLDAPGPTERTVVVTDKTQITARIPMTLEEMTAANQAFQASMKAGKLVAPPTPFTEKTVGIDAIKTSMVVTVTAADDIKDATTINATAISFDALPSTNPTIPPAPAPISPVTTK
jgi:hypothetical protein